MRPSWPLIWGPCIILCCAAHALQDAMGLHYLAMGPHKHLEAHKASLVQILALWLVPYPGDCIKLISL